MLLRIFLFSMVWLMIGPPQSLRAQGGAGEGSSVVVIFNMALPDSKTVAEHYVSKRSVPTNQVLGLELPNTEIISRTDFVEKLQKPVLQFLETNRFMTFPEGTSLKKKEAGPLPVASSIRYLVLCYGVPVRIWKDPDLKEPQAAQAREELRRNEAAVDADLAILPRYYQKLPWAGPLGNSLSGVTNAAWIHPTNGLLMVTRLDGPSAAIATGLVDKAIQAERTGLWGRAYFDVRGITNGGYKIGDDWIRKAAEITRRLGNETYLDEKPETFPPGLPISHVAFYAGWYDAAVSGPFARDRIDFMPGAFAYHLHSYNGATIRSYYERWVGPLLARGATVTLGSVDEPYLEGTPDIGVFFGRWLYFGFSFGEAAYAAQESLSWQTTVVGDPLYRPFRIAPKERHAELASRKDPLLAWSHLKIVNLNLMAGTPVPELIEYLEKAEETAGSSVMLEKLGDLNASRARFQEAIDAYEAALKLCDRDGQKARLLLSLARTYSTFQKKQQALECYQRVIKECPTYGEPLVMYSRMRALAEALGRPEEVAAYDKELERLNKP